MKKEHHLTFTSESGPCTGDYLDHCNLTSTSSAAEEMADKSFEVIEKGDSLASITAILADNTSVMTGCHKGLVVKLEERLGRRLHTIGCSLHQNELPLRAIFKSLDGTTSGPLSFTGKLSCKDDLQSLAQVNFTPIVSR